jgi:beta-phosphoglucomutase-like phosphatase (HAD superfamily)
MTRIALLFDLDGTLVDTDHLHLASFQAVLAEIGGATLAQADYRARIMGHPNADIADFLFPGDPRADALIDRKEALFRTRLAAAVAPVAGAHAILLLVII